ncbi:MAG: hypothetical protein K2F69_04595 [Bacteroidaceae bacterium]|nr:hypothetical protein [Bacteroidaceae bacterium]
MKRMFALLRVAVIALVGLGFASCDEDIITGSNIQGVWSGRMYVTSEWNGHTYVSSRTEIEFCSDPFRVTQGSGYWIDRYSRAPWDYWYSPFTYRVNRGVITIRFLYDNAEITISDYSLSGDRFMGYLDYSNERFVLYKMSDGEDWSIYDEGYYYPGGYYYNRGERDFDGQPADSVSLPTRRFWNKQAYEGVEE